MSMVGTKRQVSIDLIKSIAIFGVVFIHARNGNVFSEIVSEMFRVSVPIFIIFFIYFLEKSLSKTSTKKEKYAVLKHRFITLFIPYAFFSILYFFLFNNLLDFKFHDLITGYWSGYGWPGQYFFIILFQLLFLYPILKKIIDKILDKTYVFLIFILFYAAMTYLFWSCIIISMVSDRIFIYWIPYVIMGIALAKQKTFLNYLSSKYLVIISIVLIPLEFMLLDKLAIEYSPYILPTVLTASLLVTNYFIVNQALIEEKMSTKIKKYSIFISKRSLGLFVLNPLVIYILEKIVFDSSIYNMYLSFTLNCIFTLLVFSVTLFLIILSEKTFLKKLVVN